MDDHGFGMASVRFICGTQDLHRQLETKLADFLNTDDSILFAACFDANGGLFEPLLGPEDAVVSDSLNHASIIDGIRLCKARRYRYANNDMADLEAKLTAARNEGARHVMIATDGVFSMDGYLADLPAITRLARDHDALVMVDDCHATGVMGARGAGTPDHFGVDVDILTGTLGKALGGALGGYIAGPQPVIDLLRQRARPYLFSNALPPPIVAAGLEAIRLVEQHPDLRKNLFDNARYWRAGLADLGFELLDGEHPIIPVMLGEAHLAQKMAAALFERASMSRASFSRRPARSGPYPHPDERGADQRTTGPRPCRLRQGRPRPGRDFMSLPTTMKALEKSHPAEGLCMVQAPVPEIGPDEVLIRVNKTGICGTDVHIWNWDDWAAHTVPVPMITGHEFAGEIVELGRNVTGLEIGQRCSGEGHVVGTESRQSRSGRFHLDPGTRGIGVNVPGAFADYLALPAFNVIPLPDDIPDEIGAILDPLGNAVHTALSFDLLGEDVLITGAGPIGIMAAAVARHAGARHVVITDINPDRLRLAEHVCPGLCAVDATREDLRDVMDGLGMKQGFDVGLEMSGSQQALDQMVESLIMGGKIALLGIPPGHLAGRLVPHRFQGDHDQGSLRARDVRDLVQDDRHAAERAGYRPRDNAPDAGRGFRRRLRRHEIGPVWQGGADLAVKRRSESRRRPGAVGRSRTGMPQGITAGEQGVVPRSPPWRNRRSRFPVRRSRSGACRHRRSRPCHWPRSSSGSRIRRRSGRSR